ncbi:MAG: hypothetical protein ACLRW4_02900 [Ruminococcus sp.]
MQLLIILQTIHLLQRPQSLRNSLQTEKQQCSCNWSHQYPAAVEALGADKVGCAPMIGGSAGVGATTGPWYECVMKGSENKEMAKKYVEYMYNHNADYMDLTLKIAGRTSVYEEAGKEAGNEHTTAVLETLKAAQSQAKTYGNYMGTD